MIYFICVILAVIIIILSVRFYFFQKSLQEISNGLDEILNRRLDTNALLTVSSRERHLCRLTGQLNKQLRLLRKEHLRYENGDRELKEAITNISHDLRTPLTSINGYLDLLQKELTPQQSQEASQPSGSERVPNSNGENTSKALRYLEIIRNRTDAMKRLTEELFRYSIVLSVREEAPASLSLNRVLEESLIAFCGDLERRGITPDISMPEQPVLRTLDEASLTRVFSNIISNAVKYSDGDLHVKLTAEGAVTFSNKASGLTPVTTAKLFDRFFTVETVDTPGNSKSCSMQEHLTDSEPARSFGHSTGLGLSIARLLTERMGGSIDAEYKNGELHITVQFP